jgi:hypothetical protein
MYNTMTSIQYHSWQCVSGNMLFLPCLLDCLAAELNEVQKEFDLQDECCFLNPLIGAMHPRQILALPADCYGFKPEDFVSEQCVMLAVGATCEGTQH